MPQSYFCSLLRTFCITMGLAVIVGVVSQVAEAAQIDITNCQPTRVKICSYDSAMEISLSTKSEPNQSHLIAQGETNHFTCHANCKFWLLECAEGTCQSCQSGKGHWVDHTWGKGSYHLVSLDLTSSEYHPAYSSKDLVKVEDGAVCK